MENGNLMAGFGASEQYILMLSNYLTIAQACAHFHRGRDTILAMIADGRLRAINLKKPGGKYDQWLVDPESAGIGVDLEEQIKLRQLEKRLRKCLIE